MIYYLIIHLITHYNSKLWIIYNKDIIFVFERLCDYARFSKEPDILSERLRAALGRQICLTNVQEDNIIKAIDIKAIQNQIIDKAKAYNIKSNIEIVSIDNYIKAKDYNSCVDCLKAINDSINNIINNDIFDVTLISKKVAVGDYPDDVL